MPFLDLTEGIIDPNFLDVLKLFRNKEVIDDNGVATIYPITKNFRACVVMADGAVLNRLASGEHVTTTIEVITTEKLIDGKMGYTADIIEWHETQWTVDHVSPYSNYGRGFCMALCTIRTLQGAEV